MSSRGVTPSISLREAGGHQAPAKATRTQLQEHMAGEASVSRGASAVLALASARQTRSARKEAGCRWQPAWLGGGLWCLASLEPQHGSRDRGKSVAWTTPINPPMEKSRQKPAMEVAGKAEEETVQVKKQD